MTEPSDNSAAGGPSPRRLYYFNAGFLTQRRVRRILELSGYQPRLGRPGADDLIGVWGHSPYAARGQAMAEKTGVPIVRIEDAFLRSLHPGRRGEPPLGLTIDTKGMHFDSAQPSDLETILSEHPLDDAHLLNRARGAIARLQEAHLSKYAAVDPDAPLPDPGYVLVIDQTRGDASVRKSRADANTFREMLYYAQEEHPNARIIIKTHPETAQGLRDGYFDETALTQDRISLFSDPVSPWALFEGAIAVYTVSSQLGFEAILMGHRPVVFGQPFYAGWGQSDDRMPVQRRQRNLTRVQLFAAAMILYPRWYDPYRDQLCEIEQVIDTLDTQARAWREDRHGWQAAGMRLWKRKALNGFFGAQTPIKFDDDLSQPTGRRRMIWASKADLVPQGTLRVEDGFLRSRGLGAELVAPLSLVCDDLGIYYDPNQESRLERLIKARAPLRPDQRQRAERLIDALVQNDLSKYNLTAPPPELADAPDRGTCQRILVPGQVEDDASILKGTDQVTSNLDLLRATRAANPDAYILYKPHPDVEAGLRMGQIAPEQALEYADQLLQRTDPMACLAQVDAVWTLTSLLGFEALLRGVSVTTLGAPFYAGWGLTRDLGPVPPRRHIPPERAQVDLAALVHAALIDYPRYLDPKTGQPCPVEVIVDRLGDGYQPRQGRLNRLLSKLQGWAAGHAHLWRRRS